MPSSFSSSIINEMINAGKEAETRQNAVKIRNSYFQLQEMQSSKEEIQNKRMAAIRNGITSNIFKISSLKICLKSFTIRIARFFIVFHFSP
ncbi:MAG: hypothetical protein HC906_00085 [Bacteroidales bacterium]|nr:hypothetical protein [Bacteroidales bacterium]